jgi:hypothetical protein
MTTPLRSFRSSPARQLLKEAGLTPVGPVTWGTRVPSRRPGVYVVETPEPLDAAPLYLPAIRGWLQRVPTLRVDGQRRRPTVPELAERLARFWIPRQQVIYVGLTTGQLGKRLRDYYRTPLGDPRPHAGGHWIRTLEGLESFLVWWAETPSPRQYEDDLLIGFARSFASEAAARLPERIVLPFANKATAAGVRKPHGITGSVNPILPSTAAPIEASPDRNVPTIAKSTATRDTRIREINRALQRFACARADREVGAVEAAAELDRLGLLRDTPDRAGKPLRDLLREGAIVHAYQEPNQRWHIPCAADTAGVR